ncbi:hypothetical protein GLOIN_2v1781828 [Rhizophagus clarus]|uniref:Uncharacterized protein n=1 Tax=Rhizophagus clarus TaxID=94130 RepID=A0A8H3LC65_9GLOM|nr:hypothetical protein GLOIN_2v1781828 [Rhizophagus clarus]
MSKTPCSVLNSKIRGKKVYLPDDDESLISTALSLVWTKTDKKIDSCTFEQDRVRMSYKKNEGRIYYDLEESLSNFTFIDKLHLIVIKIQSLMVKIDELLELFVTMIVMGIVMIFVVEEVEAQLMPEINWKKKD